MNRQDIVNVCRQYGVSPTSTTGMGSLPNDDIISVETIVNAGKEDGSILFYKPQQSPYFPLQDDDFVLVIQSDYQRAMFEQYGSDRVCMDSTHGTTGYDFNLTSVFVVDEMEQGFPVAFCISTRVNHETMVLFFKSLLGEKEKIKIR